MTRLYRLMNLGVGEENEGKYGILGSLFAVCDACLPLYDPKVTNNIDTRLMAEPGYTDEPCSCYAHAVRKALRNAAAPQPAESHEK